jgi:DNA modification methylase
VRRATISERVELAASLVSGSKEPAIVWCGLNEESRLVAAAIEGAVELTGSEPVEAKIEKIEAFVLGQVRCLVTKTKIAGFGMNFQHCSHMVFLGLNDSWEGYYQAIRRCWRFGQSRPVQVDIVISDVEEEVWMNVMRKEREARDMADRLAGEMSTYEREELANTSEENDYRTDSATGKLWRVMLGDSSERLGEIESESVDLAVFSPPFGSLFTYSPTARDLGNSKTDSEFFAHFGFVIRELFRVLRPGRLVCCHCQQLPMTKMHDGAIGLKDFRGDLIRAFSAEKWISHGEICIDKDPQAQAIRTKAKGLLFVTKNKDSSWLRQAFADYILLFRKPGENPNPVQTDVTNDEWILWARPVWYGIRETETLTVAEGRDAKDEKHICPLQLETIERCVRLWSNPGELVLSPFAGIGSEGYVAVRNQRRFVGIELKESYFRAAVMNLQRAEASKDQLDFFE